MATKKSKPKENYKDMNTHTAVKPPLGSGKSSRDVSYLPGGTRVSKPRTKTPNNLSASKSMRLTSTSNRLTGVNLAGSTPVYPTSTSNRLTGVNHQSKPKTAKSKKK